MKFIKSVSLILLFLVLACHGLPVHAKSVVISAVQTSEGLIAGVNALRAANGIEPYRVDPILMKIAQEQADYMASLGTWTHFGPNGTRPYQRALLAGYQLAGDLSLGGYISENVGAGLNLTVDGIIQQWMGDDPHLLTMLSPTLKDIGAGVAVSGSVYFYVIDCGLSTGGTPVPYTPPANIPTQTRIPNTPREDGSIIHIVQKNETLFGMALSYQIPLDDILAYNGLKIDSTIYIGEQLIIRRPFTPTATLPTPTQTNFPTATLWPTSTPTQTATPLHKSTSGNTLSPGMPASITILIMVIILVSALGAAGMFMVSARKKR